MNETETKTAALLARLPELQDGKLPPIDANLTTELVRTILAGGKEAVIALIDALREVDNGGDWKARFLLQALVVAVGPAAQAAPRNTLAAILLDEAAGTRPAAVRTFLLARLRLLADPTAVAKLVTLLASDNPPLTDAAAAVLVSIGTPSKEPLAAALKAAQGRQQEVIKNALAQLR